MTELRPHGEHLVLLEHVSARQLLTLEKSVFYTSLFAVCWMTLSAVRTSHGVWETL